MIDYRVKLLYAEIGTFETKQFQLSKQFVEVVVFLADGCMIRDFRHNIIYLSVKQIPFEFCCYAKKRLGIANFYPRLFVLSQNTYITDRQHIMTIDRGA